MDIKIKQEQIKISITNWKGQLEKTNTCLGSRLKTERAKKQMPTLSHTHMAPQTCRQLHGTSLKPYV